MIRMILEIALLIAIRPLLILLFNAIAIIALFKSLPFIFEVLFSF